MDVPRPALGRRGRSVRERHSTLPRRAHAAVLAVLRRAAGAAAGELTIGGSVIDLSLSPGGVGYTYLFSYGPYRSFPVKRASGNETLVETKSKAGAMFKPLS